MPSLYTPVRALSGWRVHRYGVGYSIRTALRHTTLRSSLAVDIPEVIPSPRRGLQLWWPALFAGVRHSFLKTSGLGSLRGCATRHPSFVLVTIV